MGMLEIGQQAVRENACPHSADVKSAAASGNHAISVVDSTLAVTCQPGASVLEAFEKARNPLVAGGDVVVHVGCRRGGCGVCKVRVLDGDYRATAMSRAHVSESEQADGYVLACCVYPETDLTVKSVPLSPRKLK